MIAKLIRFMLKLFARPVPPAPDLQHFNAASSSQPVIDGKRLHITFDGIDLSSISSVYLNKGDESEPLGVALSENTVWVNPSTSAHYLDEDGELRPLRHNRDGLSVMAIDELAAEFLRAKSDADAAPDPLEREFIAALRDTYGRELYIRAIKGASTVHVGGCSYLICAVPGKTVYLVAV